METRKRKESNVVVFMALMFLCRFLLFGMNVLLWILLDAGWLCGKEVTKQRVTNGNLIMERNNEGQQSR
jgi:hypothetical protein